MRPAAAGIYLLRSWHPRGWRLLMFLAAAVTWAFFTPDIELHHFQAMKRVCHTCCDPQECEAGMAVGGEEHLPSCPRRLAP